MTDPEMQDVRRVLVIAHTGREDARDIAGQFCRSLHAHGMVLRLLHPATPFVTEELWDRFGYGPEFSLIRAPWPEAAPVGGAEEARVELDWVVRLISEVRAARAEVNVPPSVTTPLLLKDAAPETDPAVAPGAGCSDIALSSPIRCASTHRPSCHDDIVASREPAQPRSAGQGSRSMTSSVAPAGTSPTSSGTMARALARPRPVTR